MHPAHLATVCVLLLAGNSVAQDTMSAKTLAAMKRATVLVKVEVRDLTGSGSGFVISVDGDSALVVTNHHVVEPKIKFEVSPKSVGPKGKPSPFGRGPGMSPRTVTLLLKDADVTLVFDSGTKMEREAKAEILAVDPERDLAVLRVKGVKDLPEPIDPGKLPELVETMTVYSFGFPFGKVLATGKGHPALTVGKAAISSLHNDDGELAVVQIDGTLNPGNSGGPIVDAEGRLVGVAHAIIKDSSGIGLAIPGGEVQKTLLGRLAAFHLTSKEAKDKTAIAVEAVVIDPLDKIKAVTLHYLPAAGVKDDIAALAGQPGCRSINLTLEKHVASGELTVDAKDAGRELLLQAEFVNAAGNKVTGKVQRQKAKSAAAVVKVPNEPGPTYTYSQATGNLTLDNKLVGVGYSGQGAAKNDNAKQADRDGPIPLGDYLFVGVHNDPRLGGKVLRLLPVAGGSYFGRFPKEPFAIIPATATPPSGCIVVVPQEVFDNLSTQPLRTKLQVVK